MRVLVEDQQGGACGIGSRSNDGIINFGIISSGGGDVFVTGTGGTGDGGVIRGIDNIGTITSGGAGNVTVTGIGGSGGGTLNDGILNFIWSTIRSGGAGYVQVTGTGGGGASGGNNRGVKNVGGTITSGGGEGGGPLRRCSHSTRCICSSLSCRCCV